MPSTLPDVRLARPASLVLLLLAVIAASASAAAPSGPSLGLIALSPKDVGGGARVSSQRGLRSPGYESAFQRELEFRTGTVGSSVLFYLTSTVELARTDATTKADLAEVRKTLSTPKGRVAAVKVIEAELRRSLGKSLQAAAMGTIRSPRIGGSALVVPISVKTTSGRLQVVVSYLRVDRVLVTMTTVGLPVGRRDLDQLLRLTAAKAVVQLAPINVSPPSVSGSVQVGRELVATSGSWANRPTAYGYHWSRCDSTGVGCVTIPGATGATYVVAANDTGSTLRVAVTARNGAGAKTAVSAQTGLVTP
jgi:hypothetical protein